MSGPGISLVQATSTKGKIMQIVPVKPGDVVIDTFGLCLYGDTNPRAFERLVVDKILGVDEWAITILTTTGRYTNILWQRPEDYIVIRDEEPILL